MKEVLRNVLVAGFLTGGAVVAEGPPVNAGGGPCQEDCGPGWPYITPRSVRTIERNGYNILYNERPYWDEQNEGYVHVRDSFLRVESTAKFPLFGWRIFIGRIKGERELAEECEVEELFPAPWDWLNVSIARVADPQCLQISEGESKDPRLPHSP